MTAAKQRPTDEYGGVLTGHALHWDGLGHWATGERLDGPNDNPNVGCGLCQCGAMSDWLPSITDRRVWHRRHKYEVVRRQAALPTVDEAKAAFRTASVVDVPAAVAFIRKVMFCDCFDVRTAEFADEPCDRCILLRMLAGGAE